MAWSRHQSENSIRSYGLVWFGLLRIYVALAVFQPYRDLEAGDNQSLKIQVARRGISGVMRHLWMRNRSILCMSRAIAEATVNPSGAGTKGN